MTVVVNGYGSSRVNFYQTINMRQNGEHIPPFYDGDQHSYNFQYFYGIQEEKSLRNSVHSGRPQTFGNEGAFWDYPRIAHPMEGDFIDATLFIVVFGPTGNNVIFQINWGWHFTDGKIVPIPLTGH